MGLVGSRANSCARATNSAPRIEPRSSARRVGNDVVDLEDPANAGAHLRERFVARVCNDDERAALAASTEPRALLWSFFAAKEAAFKVIAKRGPAPPFAHRLFVVSADLRCVRHEGVTLGLRVHAGAGWVHALATDDALHDEPSWAVERATGDDLGVEARGLLRRTIARRIGRDATALEVERRPAPRSWDGYEPPELLLDGRPSGIDVSLSHDGRFVACAARFALRADDDPRPDAFGA